MKTQSSWWRKLLGALFNTVIAIAVEEVGKRLEDKKDPYPKQ